ncbi:MAG: hypothetical protein LRY50_16625 [Geovibrio sp.]|nr:hypothetical protein [Geovibrio sp.]
MKELVSKEDYEDLLNWHYDMEREEQDILVRPTCAPQYYRIWHERSKAEGLDPERRSLSFGTGGGKRMHSRTVHLSAQPRGGCLPLFVFPHGGRKRL